jgi:hypothetical protein
MTVAIVIICLLAGVAVWRGSAYLFQSGQRLTVEHDRYRQELREAAEREEDERAHFAASLIRGNLLREYVKLKGDALDRLHPNVSLLIRGMADVERRLEELRHEVRGEPGHPIYIVDAHDQPPRGDTE